MSTQSFTGLDAPLAQARSPFHIRSEKGWVEKLLTAIYLAKEGDRIIVPTRHMAIVASNKLEHGSHKAGISIFICEDGKQPVLFASE